MHTRHTLSHSADLLRHVILCGTVDQGRLMSTSCNEPITKVMTRICHGCSNGGEQLIDVLELLFV